jgi:predicted alpha/beta-hydrolase family hydrolase
MQMSAARSLSEPEPLRVEVAPEESVTALIYPASSASRTGVTLILGHGAGADQRSAFMMGFAQALAARGLDVVTFNFLYMERRRRVPDPNSRLEACYRAVIEVLRQDPRLSRNELAIGGKSMGGRIATQVAAAGVGPLAGLVLLGYPLHPPGKPDQLRSKHLPNIAAPMLFVQGERDSFGTPEELRPILRTLTAPVELYVVAGGDHSFKVPKRSGVTQKDVYEAIQERIDHWLGSNLVASGGGR